MKSRAFLFPAVISLSFFNPVWAAEQYNRSGTSHIAASFLNATPSVRQSALGGYQSAVSGEATDFYSNPAALASLSIPELSVAHNQSFLETKQESAAFGAPFRNNAFGVAAQYLDYGSANRTDIDASGDPVTDLGKFRFSSVLLQFGWARRLASQLALGLSTKLWQEDQDSHSARGYGFDAGLNYASLSPYMDVSLAARNVGPSYEGNTLPHSVDVGTTFHLGKFHRALKRSALFVSADVVSAQSRAVRAGLEFDAKHFWLRTGYNSAPSENFMDHVTFGGGLRIKGWKLDYAWTSKGELGDQQRIALTLGFGLTADERERAARELDDAMQRQANQQSTHAYEAGVTAMNSGQLEEAQQLFTQSLTWDPDNEGARKTLDELRRRKNLLDANDHYHQGVELAYREQWLEAAYQWQQTLKLVPSHKEAAAALARAQKNIFHDDHATSNDDSRNQQAFNKGIQLYMDGRYNDALKQWQRLESSAPRYPHLKEFIEKANNKRLETELTEVRKNNKTTNQEVTALSQQAFTLYSLGRTADAVRAWEHALILDPSNQENQAALTKAQKKLELEKKGSADATKSKADRLNFEAMAEYSNGNLERAAEAWKAALKIDPDNTRLQRNLERVQKEMALQGTAKQ